MPRILITDTSSGFGQTIVAQFLDRGWEIIATLRNRRGAVPQLQNEANG